ncbi:membrane protein [Pontibacillus halophilus JSM 076056 = DSM 19796]|uniref:Membrane protein n=1 Tax=Pontibacillus halophilus JSM 076056 = DSM 19796 TaxID=1385510 RepID=A0A0A5IA62_9BACI|nr:DUF421 domain-containing protein [Pontibacillus halophilus]KGX92727.1 membrane protein [Pontibacillus halophilus JSM 076056 = DSM 19796]
MEFFSIFTDTIVGFLCLFALTKVLGKSQITQITAFDFIAALVLGELVGNALYDPDTGIKEILFAVFLWGLLIYSTEWVTQKFKKTRGPLEGRPNIIIYEGKVQKEEMTKGKLDMNQLQHLLRSKEIFSLRDVAFAILETDGTVSVLKSSEAQTPSRQDLELDQEPVKLPLMVISDGELIEDNIKEANVDSKWLQEELKQHDVQSYKDVMYAEYIQGEPLYVIPY